MNVPYKDVPIRGAKYRIDRMTAADGAWLLALFTERYSARKALEGAGKIQREPTEAEIEAAEKAQKAIDPDARALMMANFLLTQLKRAEIAEVQLACLSVCSKYEDKTGTVLPMPLLDGTRFLYPELERDGPTVLELTREVLAFNLSPYFSEAD